MKIKIHQLKLQNLDGFKMNCYIVEQRDTCLIIDPGFEVQKIKEWVKTRNLEVAGILLTHMHYDHICALNCFNSIVYVHNLELERIYGLEYNNLLKRIQKAKLELDFNLQKINYQTFNSNEILKIQHFKIQTLFTPGHSLGHSMFVIDEQNILSGDCIFYQTVGKTSFDFGANKTDQINSVKKILQSYDKNIKLHPGHGKTTTIEHEQKYNDFYLTHIKL